MEWATPNPLFEDLAAASLEPDDLDLLADLACRALAAVDYVPDFAVEPQLLAKLEQVLAKVVLDLRSTGLHGQVRLEVLQGGEPPHAYISYQDGTGHTSGLSPRDAGGRRSAVDTLVLVADELQDAVMDSLDAVWPVCSNHQLGAHPRPVDGRAVWWCAGAGGHNIAAIGELRLRCAGCAVAPGRRRRERSCQVTRGSRTLRAYGRPARPRCECHSRSSRFVRRMVRFPMAMTRSEGNLAANDTSASEHPW